MRILLLLTLAGPVLSFDAIQEALKRLIDKNSDPCDNFYRHVCPIGSQSFLLLALIITHSAPEETSSVFDNIWKYNDNSTSIGASVAELYKSECEKGHDVEALLDRMMKILRKPEDKYECIAPNCIHHYARDPDCGRVAGQIQAVFDYSELYTTTVMYTNGLKLAESIYVVQNISVFLNNDLEYGIENVKYLVDLMKWFALEMIQETPWTENHNSTWVTYSALDGTFLKRDYAKIMRDAYNIVFKFELEYRNCKADYGNDERSNLFCLLYVSKFHLADVKSEPLPFFKTAANAANFPPFLMFGMPMYYLATYTEERAALLGSLGMIVGHELSHTIIQDNSDAILPYFSKKVVDCIQNQYNSTCNTFKEKNCTVSDMQLDENGSDILGLQLAYKVFDDEYKDRKYETYDPLNVTYQQLFFYAASVYFCEGFPGDVIRNPDLSLNEHSSHYVRVNAIANHPAFREAFSCSDDDRMVQSVPEQCVIYGKDAPQNKRH